jgi:hypothetical protein
MKSINKAVASGQFSDVNKDELRAVSGGLFAFYGQIIFGTIAAAIVKQVNSFVKAK